jgi:hypothetical protein
MVAKCPKVYAWRTFVAFVNKSFGHRLVGQSHPLLDSIALSLFTGKLQSRDIKGNPVCAPFGLKGLREAWLLPAEVNRLPIMRRWLISWDPEASEVSATRKLTLAQKVKKFGWKNAMHYEANEIWREIAIAGGKPSIAEISRELHRRAAKSTIVTDGGVIPSAGYIKNHIISARFWSPPK